MKNAIQTPEISGELMDALGISRDTRVRRAWIEFAPFELVTVHVEIMLAPETSERIAEAFEAAAKKKRPGA